MCEYTIIFNSKHACPTNGSAGGKGWSFIFFVWLITAAYLGGGIAFNKYKMGSRASRRSRTSASGGRPGLVKDGVTFSAGQSKMAAEYIQQVPGEITAAQMATRVVGGAHRCRSRAPTGSWFLVRSPARHTVVPGAPHGHLWGCTHVVGRRRVRVGTAARVRDRVARGWLLLD